MGKDEFGFEEIVNKVTRYDDGDENTYIGEDGFVHCKKCGQAKQRWLEIPSIGMKQIVPMQCKCDSDREREIARLDAIKKHDIARNRCFKVKKMHDWTFENDDKKNPKLSEFCKRYADDFVEHMAEGRGITFTGNLGAGKTYMAACIANRLIDKGFTVLFTSLPELCRSLGSEFDGSKQENLDRLDKYSLLILDDLGVERDTPAMIENVYSIIDGRYRCGKPLIVTTNLSVAELQNTEDIRFARVYDRVLGSSYVLTMKGESRRKDKSKELQQQALTLFEF